MGLLVAFELQAVHGQNFSLVPGEVIDYVEAPNALEKLFNFNEVYIGSPSITIMPNGDYIASHDLFDNGTNEDQVRVFRSTNKGTSWTQQSTVTGAFWSTIFQHNGDLYLFGPREGAGSNGDLLIRKSTNNGVNWTSPTDANSGLLIDGDFGGTPNSPVVYNGRIWIAQGNKNVMSAPVGADLLLANSWTRSDSPNTTNTPWGSGLTITEAQVIASPQSGVVIMPKIGGLPHSIVMRVLSPTTITNFPAPADYIDLPGGEKKFGAGYDPVSGKYYVLSNPVLPAHANSGVAPELIRNTAAMLSSKDLQHWDVEKIFLYSTRLDNGTWGEGFQYLNFAIDGDDLAVVSRTAFDVGDGQEKPPRGHDSNLMTFHVIEDFRTAVPTQKLVLDTAGNRVQRFETTQHADAPLGNFHLGTSFSGAALSQPNGLAQDTNGDVYIREQAGRILRFDSLGNFYNTVAGLPAGLSFTSSSLAVSQPAQGERSWVAGAAGTWDELTNWYYWGRPDTNYEIATLGSAIAANTTIAMNGNYTMKGLRFRNSNSYLIDGPGEIVLSADTGHAVLDVQQGIHRIANPVTLYSDTDWTVAAGTRLYFQDSLILNGQTLTVTGPGQRNIDGAFLMLGGKLVTDGRNQISFNSTTQATLNGTLEFAPYDGAPLGLGATHSLFNGMNFINSTFTNVNLPVLAGTLGWSTANLYTNGTVSVIDVPNPEWTKNSSGNWEDSGNWLNHGVPNSNQEIALLGTAITSNKTIAMNGAYTLKGLRFNNPANNVYFVDGPGSITIEAAAGKGVIDVQGGIHQILNPVTLASDTDWTLAASTRLYFKDTLDLGGKTLAVTGPGQRNIDGTFVMHDGKLVTDGRNQITFSATTQATLDGTLEFVPYAGASLALGASHSLFSGMNFVNNTFTKVNLPVLSGTLGWSEANLYTNGTVTVVGVPNPEWIKNANGNWEDTGNWLNHGVPNSTQEIALFGSAITANRTITMNGSYALKGLRFNSPSNDVYTIDGPGSIFIESATGVGVIDVQAGTHEILNPVTLNSDTNWTVAAGSRLYFGDVLDLSGRTLTVTGPGNRNIDSTFVMHNGRLVTDGRNQITFGASTSATLDGTLQFVPFAGASLAPGASHDLFNGIEFVADTFDAVLLPQLGGGLHWDTSALYVTGIVSIAGALGDYNLDGTVDAADYTVWRNTLGSTTNWAADGNRNEIIDEGDYTVWKSNFGAVAAGSGALGSETVVPEPSTWALTILALTAVFVLHTDRKKLELHLHCKQRELS